VKEDETANIEG